MLLPDDKHAKAGEIALGTIPADGPPPYDSPSGSSVGMSTIARPVPPNMTVTNFLRIKRKNQSIKGSYVIDPDLHVPEELLSASASADKDSSSSDKEDIEDEMHGPRKNLEIECKNSSVTADVWLVGTETHDDVDGTERKRAELDVKSKNGSVTLRLESVTNHPFALHAHAKNGSASVAIPTNFIGPVTISAVGSWVSLSNAMKERLVTYSEANGIRICFIGDIRKAGYTGRETWTGSIVDVGSINSKVKLSFISEEVAKCSNGGGFFRWMFGG
ncbi:uncharacterized protein FOMMEDRAFT_139513 [Fomitiporia mediterranea MF3/22]|uniref:uncharacterized protein n=1 Tax=Fomitiporia mediterranea (strain MF3/22) TaxID=694068 RepID=UPI0004408DB4|nr:uncharacterized protein FOMMEDRAFT_139513 [Fomitiporia mediterranea MF3/22]EJD04783.1 hypothetical protein FOMMEDRAFT_139513 [Fomitiporia mediterranea MF3/22]